MSNFDDDSPTNNGKTMFDRSLYQFYRNNKLDYLNFTLNKFHETADTYYNKTENGNRFLGYIIDDKEIGGHAFSKGDVKNGRPKEIAPTEVSMYWYSGGTMQKVYKVRMYPWDDFGNRIRTPTALTKNPWMAPGQMPKIQAMRMAFQVTVYPIDMKANKLSPKGDDILDIIYMPDRQMYFYTGIARNRLSFKNQNLAMLKKQGYNALNTLEKSDADNKIISNRITTQNTNIARGEFGTGDVQSSGWSYNDEAQFHMNVNAFMEELVANIDGGIHLVVLRGWYDTYGFQKTSSAEGGRVDWPWARGPSKIVDYKEKREKTIALMRAGSFSGVAKDSITGEQTGWNFTASLVTFPGPAGPEIGATRLPINGHQVGEAVKIHIGHLETAQAANVWNAIRKMATKPAKQPNKVLFKWHKGDDNRRSGSSAPPDPKAGITTIHVDFYPLYPDTLGQDA